MRGILFRREAQNDGASQGAQLIRSTLIETLETDFHTVLLRKSFPSVVIPIIACANRQSVRCAESIEELDQQVFNPQLVEFFKNFGSGQRGSRRVADDQEGRKKVVAAGGYGLLKVQPIDEPGCFRPLERPDHPSPRFQSISIRCLRPNLSL